MDEQKKNPLVSVGLMTYNRAHYLPGVLDSWLSQTYRNFEIILSDDASTDGTQKICEEYARRDPRIKYFRQEKNLGNPACYKFVLGKAKGEYFMWASDDDTWDERFLDDCVKVFQSDPSLVMVFANMVDIDRSRAVIKELDPADYFPFSKNAYKRLRANIIHYFSDGKNQLLYGLWKREKILADDPLFGYEAQDDRPPFYWGFSNFFIFRNLAKGPVGLVPHIRFFRRSRVTEEYRPPRSFVPRLYVTFVERLKKIFGTPYFWYQMRCIMSASGLSFFQKLKLLAWTKYAMARLFFVRKI